MSTNNGDRITLELNVTAPDFELVDIYGRTIKLQDYKGKKVFIGFFRHAGCPFCNLRIHFLQTKRREFKERNMEMIFFFQSTQHVLLCSPFHKEMSPIPLISDPELTWYDTYGIENSAIKSVKSHLTSFIQNAIKAKMKGLPVHYMAGKESISTMPAEFLLDENLIIRRIHYSRELDDRMDFDHIYEFLLKGRV